MRVLVVGDIRLLRDGLVEYLQRQPKIAIAGAASHSSTAVAKALELLPDVVLVDMAMHDSLRTVREIAKRAPGLRVVALSVPEEGEPVIACAEAGIAAYVSREGSLRDLTRTLESVMRDEASVPPRIAGALLRRLGSLALGRTDSAATSPLTDREEEIARLVEEGLSNKQIARQLRIKLPTVKNHVHNILEKLQVSRRTHVADRRRRLVAPAHASDRGQAVTEDRAI